MTESEFEELIIQLKNKLYRFAFSILKQEEDACDAVQEVVVRLWKNREMLSKTGNPESYCMSSVKNYSLDLLRRKNQHSDYTKGLKEPYKQRVDYNNYDNRDLIEQMLIKIQQLPAQQRMALELKDFQGYEYEEISKILDMSINSVRVNVSRGRKKIYEYFKEDLKNV